MGVSLSLTKAGSAERAQSVMQEHANIVAAIKAQDPVAARAAMEFHILQAKRRLTDRSFEP
ncbi:FCD domain protein [compost metagenome]